MQVDTARSRLTAALTPYRLLDHPFYRRWVDGQLGHVELTRYAEQYRHYEAALPDLLGVIADGLTEPEPRGYVAEIRDDECGAGGWPSHLRLFDRFALAVGAQPAAPTEATAALLDVYRTATGTGPTAGLAAVCAYELQAADVSTSKAAGLRRWFDLDGPAVEFWDVHAELDRTHADWIVTAAAASPDPAELEEWAGTAARAWWGFLDEREALAG